MSVQIAFSRLANVELLKNFTEAEAGELMAVCDEVVGQTGDVILEVGQTSRALYIVVDGSIEIDFEVPKLGERVVVQLAPGSVFGEISFFHGAPHSATARCLAPTTLIKLDRSQYDALLAQSHVAALKVGANAATILATRLQSTDQWIVEMLEQWQEAKIHQSYLRFRQRMGIDFSGTTGSLFTPGGL
jgi:CRP-like cAMP-binding protein